MTNRLDSIATTYKVTFDTFSTHHYIILSMTLLNGKLDRLTLFPCQSSSFIRLRWLLESHRTSRLASQEARGVKE
jgi:hypothetical protein